MVEFKGEDALKYGTNEAIAINFFRYWISKNRANEKHFYDGRYWTYNSIKSFREIFYFWSEKQIRRTLDALVTKGVLIKGNYNKMVYDRTCWYAFVDEELFLGRQNDLTKKTNENCPNGQMGVAQKGEPIPVSIPISNTVSNSRKRKVFVPPTVEEIKEYCEKRNNGVDAQRFFDYYNDSDWLDKNGEPVRNWKQKIIAAWERNTQPKQEEKKSKLPENLRGKMLSEMTSEELQIYYSIYG